MARFSGNLNPSGAWTMLSVESEPQHEILPVFLSHHGLFINNYKEMERNYDNVLSPDFNDPLQYFDYSLATSRTTAPIYAEDPWSSTPEGAFAFDTTSPYNIEEDLSNNNIYIQSNREEIGTEITPFNVLSKYHIKIEEESSNQLSSGCRHS